MNRMAPPNPLFRGAQQMNRGGGLLSQLFGRGTGARGMGMNGLAGMQNAGRAATGGGSLLQNLTNPAGISGFLNNTQQVIKTAQTIGPMIQQYGPIVKNLPAMWKLYRGLKSATADTDTKATETTEKNENQEESSDNKAASSAKKKPISKKGQGSQSGMARKKSPSTHTKMSTNREKGASIPKLYI
ncbi:VrrA/YqfQ family protein [Neobacillus sp. SM06]|uniref:VrrA/YqfQ family protein n=1 Tax=Neobacillus sp. SM06 TaxID=3422492 RepID=UPI003D2C7495